MKTIQQSKLLGNLFDNVGESQRLSVLHIGAALPETVDFFSDYRCKLYFVDVFSELPIVADEDGGPSLYEQLTDLLRFPPDTHFDICLFWDLFNYLGRDAIAVFIDLLRPHLRADTRAHGFAVRSPRAQQSAQSYAIRRCDELSVRPRQEILPGYAPHAQSELQQLLNCFRFDHSVLLPDGRLELQFSVK